MDKRDALDAIEMEYDRASCIHGSMASPHEGWAVIYEELEELKTEVFKKDSDPKLLRKEAVQVGAMALRFLVDLL